MKKLAVIGLGHIGGSVAIGARKRRIAKVVGVETNAEHARLAKQSGIVDEVVAAIPPVDLVVVAVPLPATVECAMAALKAAPEAVVTDVAGLKADVVQRLDDPRFVGGHPMAGTTGKGPGSVDVDLFVGRTVVLTPAAATSPSSLELVEWLWKALGATTILREDALAHDRAIAQVSHLPHVLAYALAGATDEEARRFAGPSFESATRVAASDPETWADLLLANRAALGAALRVHRARLDEIAAALEESDRARLVAALTRGS